MKRLPLLFLLVTSLAAPAAAQAEVGPDYITSDNVTLTDRIKTVGDGVGAHIVGQYMYVTTTKSLTIFDIKTDPAHPIQVGQDTMDVEFENEEVPTNGRTLAISSQIGCADPTAANIGQTGTVGTSSTGCLTFYDVSDPAAVKRIKSVAGAGQHTSECIFDCTWTWGSTGAVTDNRDPKDPKLVEGVDWRKDLPKDSEGGDIGCHHIREIVPGIILGSCQPMVVLSVRPEDGGSVTKPVVLATGANEDNRFIHSSRWPNQGKDKFLLSGGETNAQSACTDKVGAFMVWDASNVVDGNGGFKRGSQFSLLSEVRPTNGTYADGHSPYNGLGCSVHWFMEHPTFKNGGLVALAEYENGDRFLQITPEGKIVEQGFFVPLGGSTSAPHWNPYDPTIVYSIDYGRGVDVLKYTGQTYVPGEAPNPNATPGTGGAKAGSSGAPCASAAGFSSVSARRSGRGLRFTSNVREKRSFNVQLFQQSEGRRILNNRTRASFKGRRGSFTWKGRRGLTNGYYFARFTMALDNGLKDVRRVTLRRSNGRFVAARDFYQRTDCGVFKSYKLSSSVFGGRSNRSLGIAYQLARGADGVSIDVKVGKKVIKRLRGGGDRNKTYRYSLKANTVKRGQTVSVTATVSQGSPVKAQTLYAKRL